LSQNGVRKEDLDETLLKKLQKLVESRVYGVDEVISEILKKLKM